MSILVLKLWKSNYFVTYFYVKFNKLMTHNFDIGTSMLI